MIQIYRTLFNEILVIFSLSLTYNYGTPNFESESQISNIEFQTLNFKSKILNLKSEHSKYEIQGLSSRFK